MSNIDDLFMACRGPCARYKLDETFIVDGFQYATDAKIIIRRPWKGENTKHGLRMPDVQSLPWDKKRYTICLPVPIVADAKRTFCEFCSDEKSEGRGCDECDYRGWYEGNSGYWLSKENGWAINDYYARLLRQHGVKELQCSTPPATTNPYRFAIDDAEGLVMPWSAFSPDGILDSLPNPEVAR